MIDQISVILAVLVFTGIIIYKFFKKQPVDLKGLIKAALSASMMPTAFLLLMLVFDPDLISQIKDLSVQIAVTGLVLGYISVKTIIEEIESNSS